MAWHAETWPRPETVKYVSSNSTLQSVEVGSLVLELKSIAVQDLGYWSLGVRGMAIFTPLQMYLRIRHWGARRHQYRSTWGTGLWGKIIPAQLPAGFILDTP